MSIGENFVGKHIRGKRQILGTLIDPLFNHPWRYLEMKLQGVDGFANAKGLSAVMCRVSQADRAGRPLYIGQRRSAAERPSPEERLLPLAQHTVR